MPPSGFSWVDRPHLAALAYPDEPEDLAYLRANGIDLLICLSESAPARRWVNEAGLMLVHLPVRDMQAPFPEQFDAILEAIQKAHIAKMGVAIHCAAGLGRTGTALAVYFVNKGMTAEDAIRNVRTLRPGSIETRTQEDAIHDFARRKPGE